MDNWKANERPWAFRRWRRLRWVRPYVAQSREQAPELFSPHPLSLLLRVRDGLCALPAATGARPAAAHPPTHPPMAPPMLPPDERTPLVRHIDAQRARTVADRTPTEEIPVVAMGVSWR